MTAKKRYPAGVANFNGDATRCVGEVRGPRTFGDLVVAYCATYDPAVDATRVDYATLTDADYQVVADSGVGVLPVPRVCSPFHEGGEWTEGHDPFIVEFAGDWRTA